MHTARLQVQLLQGFNLVGSRLVVPGVLGISCEFALRTHVKHGGVQSLVLVAWHAIRHRSCADQYLGLRMRSRLSPPHRHSQPFMRQSAVSGCA